MSAPSGVRRHADALDGRVLLAEDGPDNQLLIATILRRAGADVTVVENGRLAIDAASTALRERRPFALVLMDMEMPEVDGYGATETLRTNGYRLPIVALTAHSMEHDRERCLAVGCDAFITKPVDRNDLLAIVRRYVRGEPSERDAETTLGPKDVARAEQTNSAPARDLIFSTCADDDAIADLVLEFVAELPNRALALEDAFAERNFSVVSQLAHQLRGASGGYGFPQVSELAARLETASKQASDDVATLVLQLCDLCRRARASNHSPR